jgi:hypothetical protein
VSADWGFQQHPCREVFSLLCASPELLQSLHSRLLPDQVSVFSLCPSLPRRSTLDQSVKQVSRVRACRVGRIAPNRGAGPRDSAIRQKRVPRLIDDSAIRLLRLVDPAGLIGCLACCAQKSLTMCVYCTAASAMRLLCVIRQARLSHSADERCTISCVLPWLNIRA